MLRSRQYDVDSFNWLPVASFSFVMFIGSCGILSLPFMLIAEILPEKIKDIGMSFCMTLNWFLAFISIKCLPLIIETLEFHGSMFLFAGVCILSSIYIIIGIPETKGKNYEQIMDSLR